jgi:hypothetical protein
MMSWADKLFVWIFYLIVFLLPVNLGKHFVADFSYLDGILIDYWIPTLYLQDLLILVLVFIGLVIKNLPRSPFIILFTVLLLVNLLFSNQFAATTVFSVRLLLYVVFAVTVFHSKNLLDLPSLIKFLYIGTFLICLLALFQWAKQGSLFNNYVFFGEQPYSISSPNILKQHMFGNTVVPPYSLFRHPNILGGYLSIVLVIFAYYLKGIHKHLILFLGSTVLFMTFSYAAWLSYLIGLLYISISHGVVRKLIYVLIFTIFVMGVFGFFNKDFFGAHSLVGRRFLLTSAAVDSFTTNPLFGTGLNTSLITSKSLSYMSRELNFFQPPHNIAWLILTEGGLFLFIPFVLFYFYVLLSSRAISRALTIVLLQFVVLGSFDHYILTIHQTLLLLLLTISFSLNYTFRHEI